MKTTFISWLLASRPKTLTAAFVPIFVATSLAWSERGAADWELSLYALLAAVFIQIGTNLFNDALDFKKGADTAARLGPVRVTQAGLLFSHQVLIGGVMCYAVALLVGIPLMYKGGWPLGFLLALSVTCGYLYTGGPYPLAYHGLGDLFVLLFFGFVATGSVYYLQTGFLTWEALIAGAQIGLLAALLVAINNLRDIVGDAEANKQTIPVQFGIAFARKEIAALIVAPFCLNLVWILHGKFWAGSLPFAVLPLGTMIIRGVYSQEPGRIYNRFLGMAALLHATFGILLGFGLAAG